VRYEVSQELLSVKLPFRLCPASLGVEITVIARVGHTCLGWLLPPPALLLSYTVLQCVKPGREISTIKFHYISHNLLPVSARSKVLIWIVRPDVWDLACKGESVVDFTLGARDAWLGELAVDAVARLERGRLGCAAVDRDRLEEAELERVDELELEDERVAVLVKGGHHRVELCNRPAQHAMVDRVPM